MTRRTTEHVHRGGIHMLRAAQAFSGRTRAAARVAASKLRSMGVRRGEASRHPPQPSAGVSKKRSSGKDRSR